MKLRTTGYYKEMPHGQETDPRMEEFINQEDPEQAEMICNYLRNGSALIEHGYGLVIWLTMLNLIC